MSRRPRGVHTCAGLLSENLARSFSRVAFLLAFLGVAFCPRLMPRLLGCLGCRVRGRCPRCVLPSPPVAAYKFVIVRPPPPRAGKVGFPTIFGVVSYRIRILMYRDVSCVYP